MTTNELNVKGIFKVCDLASGCHRFKTRLLTLISYVGMFYNLYKVSFCICKVYLTGQELMVKWSHKCFRAGHNAWKRVKACILALTTCWNESTHVPTWKCRQAPPLAHMAAFSYSMCFLMHRPALKLPYSLCECVCPNAGDQLRPLKTDGCAR